VKLWNQELLGAGPLGAPDPAAADHAGQARRSNQAIARAIFIWSAVSFTKTAVHAKPAGE